MLTIEEVKKLLEDRNLAEVQRRTGLSYHQVRSVQTGQVIHPSYEVIKALSDYLESQKG